MLYLVVNKDRDVVWLATYNKDDLLRFGDLELVARYWDEAEIYEVK